MRRLLFDQLVIAFGVYIGVDIAPVAQALEVMIHWVTPKFKNRNDEKIN